LAKIPNKVMNKINLFLDLLAKNNIDVQKVVLFGSYANGTYNKYSDIDITLVSKKFKGNRFLDKNLIRSLAIQAGSDIEVLLFSVRNFKEEDLFVKEILETGIKLIS